MGGVGSGKRGTVEERLMRHVLVNAETGCWEWTGTRTRNGYGQIGVAGRIRYAHRVSYEAFVAAIPSGLHVDHLCRVRHCVNPKHMEPVPQKTNTLRGEAPTARHARKTHCPSGHEYAGDNLYTDRNGGRSCRTCHRERARKARRHEEVANG